MTAQLRTHQLRPRYAFMYAVGIVALLAVMATSAAWTKVDHQGLTMDVSAMMSGIDIGTLPVQGHIDAF
jgi:predicted ribosomally synthesized peptide with SipW-like signal peptide